MEESTNIKVLDRALLLIEELDKGPRGVNELAKVCGLNPASTFRILKTLLAHGFVWQGEDEKYSIGTRLSYVSSNHSFLSELCETAYYRMKKLSDTEHEAMNLVVRDYDRCYIICQSRTGKIVDYVPPVGTYLPFHASACGKILLAGLDETTRDRILDSIDYKKLTDSTITSREEFVSGLCKAREQGFAIDAHESQAEGFCVAVPVRDKKGGTIAALSFSGFIGRRTVDEVDHYVKLLKAASAEITDELFEKETKIES